MSSLPDATTSCARLEGRSQAACLRVTASISRKTVVLVGLVAAEQQRQRRPGARSAARAARVGPHLKKYKKYGNSSPT
jgi:hypothetical protein